MEVIEGRKVVAVMGGHGMERSDPEYSRVARFARSLTRLGYLMISGGGLGAMEATHLGAYLAARGDQALDEAVGILAPRPAGADAGTEYSDPDWLHRAWKVMQRYPIPNGAKAESMSVGIPTWLYGHEPPTPFASHIAKYFANSVREDGVLMIARHGVIFVKGSAGTTQEIFQDAAQNHYRTAGWCSPMILLGVDFWTRQRPVWPLLQTMSRSQRWGEHLAISDSESEVVRHITGFSRD